MQSTYQLFCGRCNQPLKSHPYTRETMDEYDTPCNRYDLDYENLHWYVDDPEDTESFWTTEAVEGFDYYSRPPLKEVIPYADYSYNPSDIFTEETREVTEWADLFDYYQANSNPADNWYDAEQKQCTYAIDRWLVTPTTIQYGPYAQPKTSTEVTETLLLDGEYVVEHRTLSFSLDKLATEKKRDATPANHTHGFVDELLIDADITERKQRAVFNVWIGRDKKLRIGQLTLSYHNGLPSVTCNHHDCRNAPSYDFTGPITRASMEDYIERVIRHGNNHGPGWLTSRDSFTYIHAANCDASEHHITFRPEVIKNRGKWENAYVPVATPCNTNKPIFVVADIDPNDMHACYEVLLQHRKLCSDIQCRCDHYESLLWDELYGVSLADYQPKHRKEQSNA